ncbi:dienelactone hydrolase family protein [Aurantiacibacter aquimixticola]|uniref:Dienelactone hydrolase family protein n=2 Tax=Aurantiacibacter aquimixticola TaxID=1958945 RepID=A0A419RWY6_9SPHN|nr:dienelactone hydrolase family protein [Aurantiacibacter aquimixticola]
MCERDHFQGRTGLTRREFGAIGVAGAASACAPMASGNATDTGIASDTVSFAADGGTMDGVFLRPSSGAHPGVILWPDIAGLRPAKVQMGRRLAGEGYAVFVANPYYRSVSGQQFSDFESFREADGFAAVRPWRERNTPEAIMATARDVVSWLDQQDAVDSTRGIGNQGYCMTGSWTIMSAAAVPGRVKAAASFHGGQLVGDAPNAPANLLDDMADDAGALIAIAQDDDADDPGAKVALANAGSAAAADVTVDVYAGDHGWTVLDSPAYAEDAAERAWSALKALYDTHL